MHFQKRVTKISFYLIIIFFSLNLNAQETTYHYPEKDLIINQDYYLFGNDVKFRTEPNTSSKTIVLLAIGTKVKVLEKTIHTLSYNGYNSSFYKVKHNNQTGFILKGLLALEKKKVNNYTFYFNFKKKDEEYNIEIRAVNQKNDIQETSSKLENAFISLEAYNNKGLPNLESILFISYTAEACGENGGGIYFFKQNNTFKKVFEVEQISDSGVFYNV